MESLFENKTKYTEKLYKIFLKAYQEEYGKSDKLFFIYNLVFFGICMIIAFKSNETKLGIGILIGLLIYLGFKIIRPMRQKQKTEQGPKLKGQFVNTYKFYKNYFKVENPEGDAQIVYFNLYRVVETNDNYYLYISREAAFIVSKIGFIKGTDLEFSSFIKKKAFTKYRNRKKKIKNSHA